MDNKQFLVIGLGRFGTAIAKTLYSLGNDVLAIDKNEDLVEDIADYVTHAIQMDATDEIDLESLGINNFDVAVVAIGSDVQSSIMTTLLVKELGIKHIIAKAQDEKHSKVLQRIGADRVILPEKEMGVRIAHNLVSSNILDYIELSADYSIIEIKVLRKWRGKSLKELNLRARYGINVIAIRRLGSVNLSPLADDIIYEDDILAAIGSVDNLNMLEEMISD